MLQPARFLKSFEGHHEKAAFSSIDDARRKARSIKLDLGLKNGRIDACRGSCPGAWCRF
ncbi:hypothetical protein [Sphingobium yanoikuyae]|uniref:hypothetical protein n=1 Tax=Sphingobium yanoikuyae TaxID=13690 RepID=UPI001F2539B2|nr:hypothetical protein [Sphingobium yanoikuyae]